MLSAGLSLTALFAITLTLTGVAWLPTHAQPTTYDVTLPPTFGNITPIPKPTYGNQFPPGFDNTTPAAQPPLRAPAAGAPTITRDEAVAIGLSKVNGSVAASPAEATLRSAADLPNLPPEFAPDYPIWSVHVDGLFNPAFGGPYGTPRLQYTHLTMYLDAISGEFLGEQMTGSTPAP